MHTQVANMTGVRSGEERREERIPEEEQSLDSQSAVEGRLQLVPSLRISNNLLIYFISWGSFHG